VPALIDTNLRSGGGIGGGWADAGSERKLDCLGKNRVIGPRPRPVPFSSLPLITKWLQISDQIEGQCFSFSYLFHQLFVSFRCLCLLPLFPTSAAAQCKKYPREVSFPTDWIPQFRQNSLCPIGFNPWPASPISLHRSQPYRTES